MSVWWWGAPQYVSNCCVMSRQQGDIISQLWSDTTPISHIYTLVLYMLPIIKANFRTSRFDGGKNRGWLFNEYGDPILVRSVSPCWLQESNVSLLLWPAAFPLGGTSSTSHLKRHSRNRSLVRMWRPVKGTDWGEGRGEIFRGYISSSIHCYCYW